MTDSKRLRLDSKGSIPHGKDFVWSVKGLNEDRVGKGALWKTTIADLEPKCLRVFGLCNPVAM